MHSVKIGYCIKFLCKKKYLVLRDVKIIRIIVYFICVCWINYCFDKSQETNLVFQNTQLSLAMEMSKKIEKCFVSGQKAYTRSGLKIGLLV